MCACMSKLAKALKFVLSTVSVAQYNFVDTKNVRYRKKSEHYRGNFFLQITMFLKFSRGFKDVKYKNS